MAATTVSPTPTAHPTIRPARRGRTALLLTAGVVVAGAASTVVALTVTALGAGFPPLMPAVFLPFVVLGFAAAAGGWAIVRARANRPGRVLAVLVPVLTLVSFAPDVALAATGFIPGTTATGVSALALLHLVVVGVAVPVLARALPVDGRVGR
ncbi:DUF6069 family protein [Pseudolysinimonas sp.]|uniref:DUF6069 family protein n=1 Tax=Pseudolysinimonas sp. TaxID=2680009 RepID=UPI003F7FD692